LRLPPSFPPRAPYFFPSAADHPHLPSFPTRRSSDLIPLLAGTAQALTFTSEATTVSDHLLSTLRSAGHGTCTVRRMFATVMPLSATCTCGRQNNAQVRTTTNSTVGPDRHSSPAPASLTKYPRATAATTA